MHILQQPSKTGKGKGVEYSLQELLEVARHLKRMNYLQRFTEHVQRNEPSINIYNFQSVHMMIFTPLMKLNSSFRGIFKLSQQWKQKLYPGATLLG